MSAVGDGEAEVATIASSELDEKTAEDQVGGDEESSKAEGRWEAALKTLSREDQERLEKVTSKEATPLSFLEDTLKATEEKKQECMKKRWKVKVKGRVLIVRDLLEKVATWIRKFMVIGDTLIQIDPVHAAAPWALVRLIMQTSINDLETFGYILQSIEKITNTIATCKIFEATYLQERRRKLDVFSQLSEAVVKLYAEILQFLLFALQYYDSSTAARIFKSGVYSKDDIDAKFSDIKYAQEPIWRLAQLAEAQKGDIMLELLDKAPEEEKLEVLQQLQGILQELRDPIVRIDDTLGGIKDSLERETRIRILKAISTAPYALHHKTAKKGRLEGSGKWLLDKEPFRDWRKDSSSSVLWLHGIPGSGKTKLTSLVVDNLIGADKLAYFYCMRNPAEPHRGEGERILASLVRQLASLRPDTPLLSPVVEQYQDAIDGMEEFEDHEWSADESESVLLQLMAAYPAVTIVIDALDEVRDEDRSGLLDVLTNLLQKSSSLLKIFISSRDNYDIVLQLRSCPNVYIDADDNAEDIASFIQDRLTAAKLLHGKLTEDLRRTIVSTLTDGARGMFRWVELQIQSLSHLKVAADIKERLGKLPQTLEESYWEIYNTILESGTNAAKIAIFTFQWLLYANEPISTVAFARLATSAMSAETFTMSIGEEEQSADQPELIKTAEIMDVCSNLVVIRNNSFELAHLSVREFLENISWRNVDVLLGERSHGAIAAACLHLLIEEIRHGLKIEAEEAEKDSKADNASPVGNSVQPNADATGETEPKAVQSPDHQANDAEETQTDAEEAEEGDETNVDQSEGADAEPGQNAEEETDTAQNDTREDSESQPQEDEDSKDKGSDGPAATVGPSSNDNEIGGDSQRVSKVVEKLNDQPGDRSISYAIAYGLSHTDASGELRKEEPLSSLLRTLLVNEVAASEVSEIFQVWSALSRSIDNDTYRSFVSLQRWRDCAALPHSPIWVPCIYGWLELVDLIYSKNRYEDIDKGRFIKSQDIPWDWSQFMGVSSVSPLYYSIVFHKPKLTEIIMSYNEDLLLGKDKSLASPLVGAARMNDIEMVTLLLTKNHGGLEVECSALHAAAERGFTDLVKLLLQHDAQVLGKGGPDALTAAASKGHLETVTVLLEAGLPSAPLTTGLHLAVYNQHADVARRLLEHKVNIEGATKALIIAITHEDQECQKVLEEFGATKEDGAVVRAIKSNIPMSAALLVKAGYDVHGYFFSDKGTALHYAVEKGYVEVVKALVEAGAEVDAKNRAARTPLHVAAMTGQVSCARVLLEHGADILAEDYAHNIPLDLAESSKYRECETAIRSAMERMLAELQGKDTVTGDAQTKAPDKEKREDTDESS